METNFFLSVNPQTEGWSPHSIECMGGGAAGYQESRINIREVGTHLNMDKYFFSMSHGYDVKITWLNNKLLKVEYPKYSDIHKAKGRVFGSNQAYNKDVVIKILYTGIDSNFGRFINGSSGCRVINRPE